MKTPSDELFNLIKSLNSEEKRLFKLFSDQKSGNHKYIHLFNLIDGRKKYDEKKLIQILQKKGILVGDFKKIKSYLLESLFLFLEYHYFNYSVEIKLQRALQRIEVLFDKGLLIAARKRFARAEQMAIENHQYPYLFSIIQWKRKIMTREGGIDAFKETEQECLKSELHYIDLYRNIVEYQKISVQVYGIFLTQGDGLDKKAITELNEMLKMPYLNDERMALSSPAKLFYWRTLGDIHLLLKNWKKCYVCIKHAIIYFGQAQPAPGEKLNLYSRLAMALRKLKKNDELLFLKEDVKKFIGSLPKKSLTNSLYNLYIPFINNYVSHHLFFLNLDEALSASDEISELVEKHAQTQNFLIFYYNLFIICFSKSDYRKALYYANKVLSVEKKGIRQDIFSKMKMLYLILHYELGHEEMLSNLGKSYQHDFEKKQSHNKTENILLNFFGKTIHVKASKRERLSAFAVLKKELETCKTQNTIHRFDFISWTESKIENRPLLDILREKVLLIR